MCAWDVYKQLSFETSQLLTMICGSFFNFQEQVSLILFKLIECDNYFNNQSHLGKYKKHSYLGLWGGYQTKKQNLNCQHCKCFLFSHKWKSWNVQKKFGIASTKSRPNLGCSGLLPYNELIIGFLLYKACELEMCTLHVQTTSIVDFVSKWSLTCFESRLQGSTLNIEACVYVKCTLILSLFFRTVKQTRNKII